MKSNVITIHGISTGGYENFALGYQVSYSESCQSKADVTLKTFEEINAITVEPSVA